jgi:hypothetical protein
MKCGFVFRDEDEEDGSGKLDNLEVQEGLLNLVHFYFEPMDSILLE